MLFFLIVTRSHHLPLITQHGAVKKKQVGGLGTETNNCMSEVLALAVVPLRNKAVNGCLRCEPVPRGTA